MVNKTVLHHIHQTSGAKMVAFGGWDMPVHYGSQMKEHEVVRTGAGMFDVSHMTVVDLRGEQVKSMLKKLLANNIDKLKNDGCGLYSCMLNASGGVIDDLITYLMAPDWSRMVVNATTREKDIAWINQVAQDYSVQVEEQSAMAMIAVQGPLAREKALSVMASHHQVGVADLKPFQACLNQEWFIARTGYTGEDGFEIILPEADAEAFWLGLSNAEVKPCGLGARDTLRLEAGLNLYGSDMDETTSPLACGLTWTVAWQPPHREFIGRRALEALQAGNSPTPRFVGLILQDKGVMRSHQKVLIDGKIVGELTSGSFSPTLQKAIGLARIEAGTATECEVQIRQKTLKAQIVKPPFVKQGKARY